MRGVRHPDLLSARDPCLINSPLILFIWLNSQTVGMAWPSPLRDTLSGMAGRRVR